MSNDWVAKAEALAPRVRPFIDGRWIDENDQGSISKFSPRDGRLLCRYGSGGIQDLNEAVQAAKRALSDGRWAKQSVQSRKDVLYKLAALIERDRDKLALLECLDVGKPIRDVLNVDIPSSAASIRASAEAMDKVNGKVYAVDGTNLSYQLHRPVGVVAAIIGWNFPLVLAAGKIGPALAMGNSLVLKPSELTSLSAAHIAALAIEAGLPEGVFNVIHGGPEVGAGLASHADVGMLTFTGSTQTGKKLMVAAGQSNMKRLLLECGGKAPNIVFTDCPDLDAVAESIVASAFFNQGQVCAASSRLLLQRGIKHEVLERVIAKTTALSPGDPLLMETTYGALVSEGHRQKVLGYVERGLQDGACMAYASRSKPPFENGFYVGPMIIDRVEPRQAIAREEIFGPVLAVLEFRDEEEALNIANSTIYGLSAVLWTKDLGRAHRMTLGIDAGWVVVNATDKPIGGAGDGVVSVGGHKESGIGVEGGIDGLASYTTSTAVQIYV
jgi:acyl-CoA reductase-like NAD-dependent aldehyde dehydrogenase